MEKERKVRLLAFLITGGLLFACLYHFGLMGGLLKKGYPQNAFLYNPDWLFSDFYETVEINRGRDPYTLQKSVYPPAASMAAFAFSRLAPKTGADIYLLVAALFFLHIGMRAFSGGGILPALRRTVFIIAASYPVLYLLDTGNFELFAFIAFYFFAIFYVREKYWLPAPLLGVSAAIKITPGVFVVLFLLERRWREAAFSVFAAGTLTLACAAAMRGGIWEIFAAMRANLADYNSQYLYKGYGLVFGNSLYGGLHSLLCFAVGRDPVRPFPWLIAAYPWLAGGLAAFFIYSAAKAAELWRKFMLLCVVMVTLPYISADYRLVYFFAPLFLFVSAKPQREGRDLVCVLLFASLLIPKHFFYFAEPEVSLSAILTPLSALALAFLAASPSGSLHWNRGRAGDFSS